MSIDASEVSALMGCLSRKYHLFMRAGGGPLIQEGKAWTKPQKRATPEQRQAAFELGKAGKHTLVEIARAVDMRPQTVADLCRRNGFVLPSGYKGRRSAYYYAERDGRAAA